LCTQPFTRHKSGMAEGGWKSAAFEAEVAAERPSHESLDSTAPVAIEPVIVCARSEARSSLTSALRACGLVDVAWCEPGDARVLAARAAHCLIILLADKAADLERAAPFTRDGAFIVVSAHEELAVRALDAGASDFVLKPIEPQRLIQALRRASSRCSANRSQARLAEMQSVIDDLRARLRALREPAAATLWVRGSTGLVRLAAHDILWMESEDDYVRLHTAERSFLLRGSLRSIAAQVGTNDFVRVHRRAMVRSNAISAVRRLPEGRIEIGLSSGVRVPAGRVYAKAIHAAAVTAARSLSNYG
jgi:DNA-binding LytR/AlgR family response regulator